MTGTFLAWPQLELGSACSLCNLTREEFLPVALALWVKSIQCKQESFKY